MENIPFHHHHPLIIHISEIECRSFRVGCLVNVVQTSDCECVCEWIASAFCIRMKSTFAHTHTLHYILHCNQNKSNLILYTRWMLVSIGNLHTQFAQYMCDQMSHCWKVLRVLYMQSCNALLLQTLHFVRLNASWLASTLASPIVHSSVEQVSKTCSTETYNYRFYQYDVLRWTFISFI